MPEGMTVRDLFAAFSLAGQRATESETFASGTPELCAARAYIDADAMLAEKARREAEEEELDNAG